jgi:hypothetical protein
MSKSFFDNSNAIPRRDNMEIKSDEELGINYIEEIKDGVRFSTHPHKAIPIATHIARSASGKSKLLYKTLKGNYFTLDYHGNYTNVSFTPIPKPRAKELWKELTEHVVTYLIAFDEEEQVEDY